MRNKTGSSQKSQDGMFFKIMVGSMILLGTISWYLIAVSPDPVKMIPKADLPMDHINPQEMWMIRMEDQSKLLSKKMNLFETSLLQTKKSEAKALKENESLHKELFLLKQELKKSKSTERVISSAVQPVIYNKKAEDPFSYSTQTDLDFQKAEIRKPLQEIVMGGRNRDLVQHVDQVIPAGTTVKALLVSSVDAPSGVFATSDPRPVKLRILDDASLPKSVRVKLKGGVVIASSYGDLSSERVMMRIERMTQTKKGGEFVETEVTGYVTGEDGKYGVRGVVVDKAEQMVSSAAVSGFFSGLSQFFQTSVNAQNIKSATDGLPNNVNWDILQRGGLQGTSNALTKLSEYYIKRAEQLQPVIQVSSGRVVDITFTHGCDIRGLHNKKKIEKVRHDNA